MNCITEFQSIYNRDPDATAFCPYRICPIGAHSDHQYRRFSCVIKPLFKRPEMLRFYGDMLFIDEEPGD